MLVSLLQYRTLTLTGPKIVTFGKFTHQNLQKAYDLYLTTAQPIARFKRHPRINCTTETRSAIQNRHELWRTRTIAQCPNRCTWRRGCAELKFLEKKWHASLSRANGSENLASCYVPWLARRLGLALPRVWWTWMERIYHIAVYCSFAQEQHFFLALTKAARFPTFRKRITQESFPFRGRRCQLLLWTCSSVHRFWVFILFFYSLACHFSCFVIGEGDHEP